MKAFLKNEYTRSRWGPEFWQVDVWFENDSGRRMIRSGFLSCAERLELEVCVRSQREDHGVARRANALLCWMMGSPVRSLRSFCTLTMILSAVGTRRIARAAGTRLLSMAEKAVYLV